MVIRKQHLHSTYLFGLSRKQMFFRELEQLQQLLFQVWFHCLSKFTHPLVPGIPTAIDLADAFSSIPVNNVHQKQFTSSRQAQHYNFTVLPHVYINSLALCHNLLLRNLDHLALPLGITLAHYIDDSIGIDLYNALSTTTYSTHHCF